MVTSTASALCCSSQGRRLRWTTQLEDTKLSGRAGLLRTHVWSMRKDALRTCALQKLRYHAPDAGRASLRRVLSAEDPSPRPGEPPLAWPDALVERVAGMLPACAPRNKRGRDAQEARMQRWAEMPSSCGGGLMCTTLTADCEEDVHLHEGREVHWRGHRLASLPLEGPPCYVQLVTLKPAPHAYAETFLHAHRAPGRALE